MVPHSAASENRDERKREPEEPSNRSRRRIRSGGEGTYEEGAEPVDCPVCGRHCED